MEVVEISDEEHLIRRYFFKPNRGHLLNGRIAPTVFHDRQGQPDPDCSVYAQSLMSDDREWCVQPVFASMGALAVVAHIPRRRGAEVIHAPLEQRSHTVIRNLTNAICAEMADKWELLGVEPCRPVPQLS